MANKNGSRAKGPRGQKRAFTPQQIAILNEMFYNEASQLRHPTAVRDYAIFRTALCTMLRASDLMALTIGDVWSPASVSVMDEVLVRQLKTNRNVRCFLQDQTRVALRSWLAYRRLGASLILDLKEPLFDIGARQYSRLVKSWAKRLGLDPRLYSTHSLRRTKAKEIYRVTKNLEAVRQLLGQATTGATSAYLGITQEDALEISKEIKL